MVRNLNPIFLTDGYKMSHQKMFPEGTTLVYSNFTPRSLKHAPEGINKVVCFGIQAVMLWLHVEFQTNFFECDKDAVIGEIKHELSQYLGTDYDVSHFAALHDLGYLPIHVKSLDEGIEVPVKTPVLTIYNTHPDFFWLPNFLETILSTMLWVPMTSASTALLYRRILTKWAKKTDPANLPFVLFQGHDFSMRGLSGLMAVILSGMGHGIVFQGSDNIPAIGGLKDFYRATGTILSSVPASEHSVMCAGLQEDELATFRRLLATYPTGVLSVVSDTWDLWKVCTEFIPALKEELLQRDGKLVIRPDSGNPADILCGSTFITSSGELYDQDTFHLVTNPNAEQKGVIQLLWEAMGGTVNAQGYKVLDPHIGAIYGDSITPAIAEDICRRLEEKGFASTNVVFGIGSYTYQYKTRDTFGFAMKATYVERTIEEPYSGAMHPEMTRKVTKGFPIFKSPVTDSGVKKSATGLLKVVKNNGEYELIQNVSWEEEAEGELTTVYVNGTFSKFETLKEIRTKIDNLINE